VRLNSELDGRVLDCEVAVEALSLEAADTARDRFHCFLGC
jgi:hypothetical protein